MTQIKKRRTKAELALARLPKPLAPLSQAAQAYWPVIMAERASSDWNTSDLQLAGKLCETLVIHTRAINALSEQDLVYETASGQTKPNPLVAMVTQLAGDVRAWYRALGLRNQRRAGVLAERAGAETDELENEADFPVFVGGSREVR